MSTVPPGEAGQNEAAPTEGEGEVFVEYEEKRTTAAGPSGRATKTKHLDFFLKTTTGRTILAAQGFDHGDAHYVYKTAPNFTLKYGSAEVRNRKDLVSWLEMVIKESRAEAEGTVELETARLGTPTPDNPEGLYYIDTRHEKNVLEDGRKLNHWYLIDQHKRQHLAVKGEERETRDGHYQYTAMEPFRSRAPLACSNQNEVMKWLEKFLTHRARESALHVGDHIKDAYPRSPKRSPHQSPKRLSNDVSNPSTPSRVSKRARTPTLKGVESQQGTDGQQVSSKSSTPTASSEPPMAFPPMNAAAAATPVPFRLSVAPAPGSPLTRDTATAPRRPSDGAALPVRAPSPATAVAAAQAPTPTPAPMPALTPALTPALATPSAQPAASAPVATTAATATQLGRAKLGGAAEQSHLRRMKALRAAAESQAASLRASALTELRQQAVAMKSVQDASKEAALRWALDPPPQPDRDHVLRFAGVLRAALQEADIPIPSSSMRPSSRDWPVSPGKGAPPQREHALGAPHARILEVLEALREVGTSYVNCQLLVSLDVAPLVQACCSYPHPNVAAMAASTLHAWRRAATQHVLVLTDPTMAIDPVDVLEEGLAEQTLVVPLPDSLQTSLASALQPAGLTPVPSQPTLAAATPLTGPDVAAATGPSKVVQAPPQAPAPPQAVEIKMVPVRDDAGTSVFASTAPPSMTPPPVNSELHNGARTDCFALLDKPDALAPMPAMPSLSLNIFGSGGREDAGIALGSPSRWRKAPRAELLEDDSNGLLIPGRGRDFNSGLYSMGFGSQLSLGSGNSTPHDSKHLPDPVGNSLSFGSKHLPEAADQVDEDVGTWGTEAEAQAEMSSFQVPEGTSIPDMVGFLERCVPLLATAKHRNVCPLCAKIKAHVERCLKDNLSYFPQEIAQEVQVQVKDLEKQACEVKEGMAARDCHAFVRVCLQHLQDMIHAMRTAVLPV